MLKAGHTRLAEGYFTIGGWGNEIVWRPSVSTSAADGTEIPFEMEILVNGNQVLTSGKSIFVDDDQPFKITAEVAAIKNCYQPHSQPHEGAYND